MKSLSLIVFEIFAKIAFFTSDLVPKSKVMAAKESNYMIFYMSVIQMKVLSLVVFEIFAKIAVLTSYFGPRSKVMAKKRKPIYDFLYVCNTNEVSISRNFQYICGNSIFDL